MGSGLHKKAFAYSVTPHASSERLYEHIQFHFLRLHLAESTVPDRVREPADEVISF